MVTLSWQFDDLGIDPQMQYTPTLCIITCITKCYEAMYTQYCPVHAKLNVCQSIQLSKLNVHHIYHVCGTNCIVTCCSMHVCLHINFVDMFDQAIKDFSASLEIKESLLPNHDRAIAEL